jgi:hypothetical protein
MTDEYWKKRAQGLNPSTLKSGPNFGMKPNGPLPSPGQDFDITSQLQSRIAQKAAEQSFGGGGGQVADLKEGMPYYTNLKTQAFGHTVPLFKTAGTIQGPTSKGVTIKGEVKGYLIDNLASVDMSTINERPELQVVLVEISVPYVGSFLVKKESIVNTSRGMLGATNSKQVLKG